MAWNEKEVRCAGEVYFRGSIPPRAQELSYLEESGCTLEPADGPTGAAWCLRVTHPDWGTARVWSLRNTPAVPAILLKFDGRLDDQERQLAGQGKSSVLLEMETSSGNILRDRKLLLRFLRAIMGDDGVVAIDALAMRFWSPAALDDELFHDADLDIESLFTIHVVGLGGSARPHWFHTHGLAEIGFFDFDVVRPSPELTGRCLDISRAIAFAIVEEKVKVDTDRYRICSAASVRFTKASEFQKRASAANRKLRDDDGTHLANRAVLCEPPNRWIDRWLDRPLPSRLLSSDLHDVVAYFPSDASRLMADRARKTYDMFCQLTDEFADLSFKPIVKLGYQVDGKEPGNLEHLWFEVNSMDDEEITATLLNVPHAVSSLRKGDCRKHSIDRLTDWSIITPLGQITPRFTKPARAARQNREQLAELARKNRESTGK